MKTMIGSARRDESGSYSGGMPGDQDQRETPDYSGEVSMQPFYVHSKGWIIMRVKNQGNALRIAQLMEEACNNPNIGYSQSDRLGVVRAGVGTKEPVNCDCSSLVRTCVKLATGVDPGDFYTGNEVEVLGSTGLFFAPIRYVPGTVLFMGDVLVTASKGHTVIVTAGEVRSGWCRTGELWQYVSSSGHFCTGWNALDCSTGKHWYYFDEFGLMRTGWVKVEGKWYYLDTTKDSNEGACWISDSDGSQHVWNL